MSNIEKFAAQAVTDLLDLIAVMSLLAAGVSFLIFLGCALWLEFRIAGMALLAAGLCAGVHFARRPYLCAEDKAIAQKYLLLLYAVEGAGILFWSGQEFGDGHFLVGLHHFVLAVLLEAICWLLYQYRLGWIVDDSGERQKVLGRDRFGVITNPTTHELRRREAFEARRKRLLFMALAGALAFMLGVAAFSAYRADSGLYVVPAALALIPALGFLYFLAVELIYQSGFPHIPGAKVTDPAPGQAGLGRVKDEMTHGDAHLAGRQGANSILNQEG